MLIVVGIAFAAYLFAGFIAARRVFVDQLGDNPRDSGPRTTKQFDTAVHCAKLAVVFWPLYIPWYLTLRVATPHERLVLKEKSSEN